MWVGGWVGGGSPPPQGSLSNSLPPIIDLDQQKQGTRDTALCIICGPLQA